MKVFGLAGWSGSGKTTLASKLLPALTRQGLTVSTIKHAHHMFDVDHEGKDSFTHRNAGATEVMITSSSRWALMHELRGEAEPDMAGLMRHMTPVDLVLIEGYKRLDHPKLEVHRAVLGKPLLCREDPKIVALACDRPLPEVDLPQFDLDDANAIAAFIVAHCALEVGAHQEA